MSDNASNNYLVWTNGEYEYGKPPFNSLGNLQEQDNNVVDPMSFELNYSKLCSNYEEDKGMIELDFPSDTHQNYGYYSESVSQYNRLFQTPPEITFLFPEKISSVGIELQFIKRFAPEKFNIKWYYVDTSQNENLITQKTFILNNGDLEDNTINSDSLSFFCENKVNNYNKVVIEFISTKYPFSRIKLNRIKFGKIETFNEDNIVSAEIFEETDILSNRISIDTLNFSIHDDKKNINPLDSKSILNYIKQGQSVTVYEYVNDNVYNPNSEDEKISTIQNKKLIGRYFIDSFESKNSTELSFKCIDLIGILEKSQFIASENYYDVPFKDIVDSIMHEAGIYNNEYDNIYYYEIDEELANKKMFGFLPICSCREALHQLLFGAGAYCYSSRENTFKMSFRKPLSQIYIHEISDNFHIDNDSINKDKFISGIKLRHGELICNDDKVKTISEGTYNRGIHNITIDGYKWNSNNEPYVEQSNNGEVIPDNMLHNISIRVLNNNSKITVKGRTQDYITSYYQKNLPDSLIETENVVSIENCYFVNERSNNVESIANELLEYYKILGKAKVEIILNNERAGDWVYIKNIYGNLCRGNILNMRIDLANGFIANAELVFYDEIGKYKNVYYCTDNDNTEMYSGENNLI